MDNPSCAMTTSRAANDQYYDNGYMQDQNNMTWYHYNAAINGSGMSHQLQHQSPRSDSAHSSTSTVAGYDHVSDVGGHYERQRANCVTPSHSACSSITTGFNNTAQATPSCTQYPGPYGFQLAFDEQPKDAKSMTWTFSSQLRKLYVRMASACPFRFSLDRAPPDGCVIRATAVYTKPEHLHDVVKRCPNHESSREFNDDHVHAPPPHHVLRCEHAQAQYHDDAYSGRHSVLVPCETLPSSSPPLGAHVVTLLYQFMCFSSCTGGLNRRPIEVVFTLERHGVVLGRQRVEVRVCACPGRDKRAEESVYDPNDVNATSKPPKRPFSQANMSHGPTAKRRRTDGAESFTLTIEGRENYEVLLRIRDALEYKTMHDATARSDATAAVTDSNGYLSDVKPVIHDLYTDRTGLEPTQ